MRVLIVLLILIFAIPSYAGVYEAIIYCNFRNPDIGDHWKPEIPDVGVDEIIRDFYVLEKQGLKLLVHALVDTSSGNDGQVLMIKNHIRNVNGCTPPTLQGPTCTTPVGQQILVWFDKTAVGMYTNLWQDRTIHAVFETIAKGTLRYKVETTCDGEPCNRIVSITDAEDTYGEVIDAQLILLPHRFLVR